MTVLSSEKEVHQKKTDFLVQGGASRRLFHITALGTKGHARQVYPTAA